MSGVRCAAQTRPPGMWCGAQTRPPGGGVGRRPAVLRGWLTQALRTAPLCRPGAQTARWLGISSSSACPELSGASALHVELCLPALLCRVLYTIPKWKFTEHFRGSGRGGQLLGSVILTPPSTPGVTGSHRSTIQSIYSFIHQAFIPVYAAMGLL